MDTPCGMHRRLACPAYLLGVTTMIFAMLCIEGLFAWGYNNAASDIDSRLPPTLEVISCSMTSCIKHTTRCIKKVPKIIANDIKDDIKPCQLVTSIAVYTRVNQLVHEKLLKRYNKVLKENLKKLQQMTSKITSSQISQ